ncbi:MAG TPA: EAL domain-containing protein, partial [Rudaea sp.]|nr:EAL domain-containing protein [Rudaea sp.]
EARMQLKPPKSSQALTLARSDYLALARELDLVVHADRHQLRGIIERVRDHHNDERELRLYVPLAVESLFDPALAPWLVAELGANNVQSNLLVLEFEAGEVRNELARLRGAMEALQRVGVRLAFSVHDGSDTDIGKLLGVDAFSAVKLGRLGEANDSPENAWEPWSNAISQARSLGKIVVAGDIAGIADLSVLLKLGVHYVQGMPLCGWLPEWSYDFGESIG